MNPLFEELLAAQAPGYTPAMPVAPTAASTGGQTDVVTPEGQSAVMGLLAPLMFPGQAAMGERQVFDANGSVLPEAAEWGTGTALGLAGASSVPFHMANDRLRKFLADQYGTAMQMMHKRLPTDQAASNGGLGGLGGLAPRA